jgi:hypothetical protein
MVEPECACSTLDGVHRAKDGVQIRRIAFSLIELCEPTSGFVEKLGAFCEIRFLELLEFIHGMRPPALR